MPTRIFTTQISGQSSGGRLTPGDSLAYTDKLAARRRRREMDVQGLRNEGALDVQGLANTGRMDVQGLANIGQMNIQGSSNVAQMARERLGQTGQTARTKLDITGRADVAGRDIAGRADVANIQQAGQTARTNIISGPGSAPRMMAETAKRRGNIFEFPIVDKLGIETGTSFRRYDPATNIFNELGVGLGPPQGLDIAGIFNWIRTNKDRGQVDLYMKDLEANDPAAFEKIKAMWGDRRARGQELLRRQKNQIFTGKINN